MPADSLADALRMGPAAFDSIGIGGRSVQAEIAGA